MAESAILDTINAAATFLGYSQLCKPQESAVKHFLLGRDVFVTLPTGSGKSSCYYLLIKAFDKLRKTATAFFWSVSISGRVSIFLHWSGFSTTHEAFSMQRNRHCAMFM